MTKQQEFLLNNHLHDIIIQDNEDASKRLYLSDVLKLYHENDFSSELIKDLGDTKRKFTIWHDGGEWIISLSGKELTNSKTLKGWLSGNE